MKHNVDHLHAKRNSDGLIVSIKDVISGKKCDCICTKCKEPLVAKKGKKKAHHFAHQSTSNCKGESKAHIDAKSIIKDKKYVHVPLINGQWKKIIFDEVKEEELIKDKDGNTSKYRADLICKTKKKDLVIEIVVTHDIDEDKLLFLRQNKISSLILYLIIHEVRHDWVNKKSGEFLVDQFLIESEDQKDWKQFGMPKGELDIKSQIVNSPEMHEPPNNFEKMVLQDSYRVWAFNQKIEDYLHSKYLKEKESKNIMERINALQSRIWKIDDKIKNKEKFESSLSLKSNENLNNEILDLYDERLIIEKELEQLLKDHDE